MATTLDIVQLAFRRLEIKAEDEALTADQESYGSEILRSIFAEVQNETDTTWTLDDVPSASVVPLANLLAVELAPSYGRSMGPRGLAWRRLMATIRADDRIGVGDAEAWM